MEETISLQDIFRTIKKRAVMIISLTVLSIIVAAIISFYVLTPIYQASTQILVNQQKTNQQIQTTEIQTDLQLINTYNVIIKSPAILSKVIERLDLELTPSQLANQITVSNAQNSQVVDVSVQDELAFRAVDIANTTAQVFQEQIQVLMKVDNVNILSPALLPEDPSPVKPNKMLNIAIAAVLGLMIGVGLAFLLDYLDTTVKTESDVEELLQLPIIGLVSPINDKDLESATSEVRKLRK
ncbi:capsular biosynthesis protein [Lysinibacillus xylanilyticus]|uniref:YveK family protein n=1 Tax=Lysinibacillus xylanilyticus TaxID=582475 RepID=UPI002B242A16|nr:Wzz/FepE/Etk N-terminal domain-containing protein [Lysinibacillus xylanilyticus]MEB2298039.1 capsular biosynthesis protein [Lysinibacillus xylanilyticus]